MVYFTYVWLIYMVHVGIPYMVLLWLLGVIKQQRGPPEPKHHGSWGTRRPGLWWSAGEMPLGIDWWKSWLVKRNPGVKKALIFKAVFLSGRGRYGGGSIHHFCTRFVLTNGISKWIRFAVGVRVCDGVERNKWRSAWNHIFLQVLSCVMGWHVRRILPWVDIA